MPLPFGGGGTEHTFIQPGGLVKFEATFAEDTGENDQPAPSGVPQLVCTVTFYCYSGDCFHAPFDVPVQVKQGLTMETHCGILKSLIGFFKPIFLFPRLCDSCRRDSHFSGSILICR